MAKRALGDEIAPVGGEIAKTKSFSLSPPAKSDSLENFESVRKDYVAANAGRLVSAPASSPAVIPPNASASYYRQEARGGEREKQQTYSQAFNNRAPTTSYDKMAKSAGITPVLVNFQVEQTGNQLRVIDGDGSTYLGEMELPATGQTIGVVSEKKGAERLNFKGKEQPAETQRAIAALPKQQSSQNFAYRVSGTNRTLNQQVVFAWNFVLPTNELAAAQIKASGRGGSILQNNLPAQQFPLLLNNSIINGRAQLGSAKEIEINAVPVPP